MRIKAAPEREDVQLVEFGDFLQELLAVWAEPRVEHRLSSAQLEVEDSLKDTTRVSERETEELSLSIHSENKLTPDLLFKGKRGNASTGTAA